MEREQLQEFISTNHAGIAAVEGGQWLNITVPADQWHDIATWLRDQPELSFDYLFCLTCIDRMKNLEMVYHLESMTHRHMVVVKIVLDRESPVTDTICDIWRTAEFHEREVCEMFGVHFNHHPDLRKLILPDDWEGFPMRKDYEDPVNLIKL